MDWRVPDEIFIETPTGSGKTTFVVETLAEHALSMGKEVLLLVNRKILKTQIKRALAKQHGINGLSDEELEIIKSFAGVTVLSYQEIQSELKCRQFFLSALNDERFFYIVFDEAHYVLQDSVFNRDIIFLLEAIPKISKAVKIFASATMEEVEPFLLQILHASGEIKECTFSSNGRSQMYFEKTFFTRGNIFSYKRRAKHNIDQVRYFEKVETLVDYINHDNTEDKWLIFVHSKSEALKLKKMISYESAYLDADVDETNSVRQQIIQNEQFDEKILITTKVLDNGINIKDIKLRNLVIMTFDRIEFIQMLGRKRFIEDEDGIRLFLAVRDTRFFNYLRNMELQPMMRCVEEIRSDNRFKQSRFEDEIFYNFCMKMTVIDKDVIVLSEAAAEKLRLELCFCEKMIERLKNDSDAFVREQLSWIGKKHKFCPNAYLEHKKQEEQKNELEVYLKKISGKKIGKEDQRKFRLQIAELVKKQGKRLTDRQSRCPGKVVINRFLSAERMPFYIESVENSKFWFLKEVGKNATKDVRD